MILVICPQKWQFGLKNENFEISRNSPYGCPIRLGVYWTSLDINFRQHEHYNREACLDHLSFCFRHNMGAPAFVNRYVNKRPAIAYPGLTGPGLGL